ncbi:MAG: ABC transporter permease [Firmicutes bacterium]|nr:ABC transporter permease [Bacillota bacterium]
MSLPRKVKFSDPLAYFGRNITTGLFRLGELIQIYLKSFKAIFFKTIFWKNTIIQMEQIGIRSLPIVSIFSLFTGMVFSLQLAKIFSTFGLSSQLGQALTLAFARELSPVLTGVVVAGRVGSSIAAEIGSMKVTEQIEALETMSTDPIDYLVAPRIVAAGFMLPVLVTYANLIGIIGGVVVATIYASIPPTNFADGVLTFVTFWDFIGGLIKALFFGLIIAGVGTYKGLYTENGAVGVGKATTEAVVVATIIIFIINYFLSMMLYNL